MSHALICGYGRSAFTPAHKGELIETRPDDLAAAVIDGVLEKTGLDPKAVEDVICGCAFPEGEQGFNLGRQLVFLSKLGKHTGGSTINRWCGSSMQAIHMAAGNIALNAGEIFLSVGVESMTRIPIGGFNPMPNPALYESYPQAYMNMGETAEEVAQLKDVSRLAMEEFALKSHEKASKADFSAEIIPISRNGEASRPSEPSAREAASHVSDSMSRSGDNYITRDGCVRPESTLEKMAELNPAFRADGRVTAATSSPLTDGAVAVIVASEEAANQHNLPKLARIKSIAVAGLEPEHMGLGPIPASKLALERAGLKASDIDIWEINEAFAAQAIPVQQELNIPEEKLNIHGGAIALGHPLGASGARITGKAAQLLHDSGGQYALASMCIGGGMGIATVLERV